MTSAAHFSALWERNNGGGGDGSPPPPLRLGLLGLAALVWGAVVFLRHQRSGGGTALRLGALGAVVALGRSRGAPTPTNEALHRILAALVEDPARWADYRGQPDRWLRELS